MQRPSRLRPARIDPLEQVGLVSKGDTSLLSYSAQENYFSVVKTRYHTLAGTSEGAQDADKENLATALASLSLGPGGSGQSAEPAKKESNNATGPTCSNSAELAMILMAMRKLREAIVASSRTDIFAKDVYLFIIRNTIILGHPESYHPALLYSFRHVVPFISLTREEKEELLGYHILDLACRQHDLIGAFRIRNLYEYRGGKIGMVLTALVHGNWVLFWKVKSDCNVYERRLMGWADERMVGYAVRCLGKSYLSIPRVYVEQCTGMQWEDLKKSKGMLWILDGETLVMKQVKRK
ncbi:MAG: hypothetical protein Q9170_006225 [Blastenia crenularia]